jgi:trk system potassium uptake protein TrkA
VPTGDDALLPGDEAYVVAAAEEVERTIKIFGHTEKTAQRVIIAGGGNIGLYVAKKLEEGSSNRRAKIVELDRNQAIKIAEILDRTVVLNGSALNEEILKEADVTSADTLIAVTNDDQVNILSSVLARRLGCERNLCLVNNMAYMPLVRSLNIGDSINPRAITVSRILQHVRRGRIRGVHSVQNGAGEIIEAEALETSPLLGAPLRDLQLPSGIRIGAIKRKGKVIIPSGSTEIRANDRIIIFSLAESVRNVEQYFRVSLEYF